MLRKILFAALLSSSTFALAATHAGAQHGHWSYSGETGPEHWAELDPAFATCAQGQQQSPINIATVYSQQLDALNFKYQPSRIAILNNGHSIQHDYDPGSFLEVGAQRYQLVQLHFHTPSEESINNRRAPMDIHLVHRNEAGELAVVAVQIEQGATNKLIGEIWSKMPREENVINTFTTQKYNVADLLPQSKQYWTFMGSLTTPPCTEGVRWLVLKEPIQLSAKQITQFKKLFKMNARPVQALNQRAVLDAQ